MDPDGKDMGKRLLSAPALERKMVWAAAMAGGMGAEESEAVDWLGDCARAAAVEKASEATAAAAARTSVKR